MSSELETKMKAALVNGKFPCAAAFQLAREMNMTPKQIGEAANKLNIRITTCQLGCFP